MIQDDDKPKPYDPKDPPKLAQAASSTAGIIDSMAGTIARQVDRAFKQMDNASTQAIAHKAAEWNHSLLKFARLPNATCLMIWKDKSYMKLTFFGEKVQYELGMAEKIPEGKIKEIATIAFGVKH